MLQERFSSTSWILTEDIEREKLSEGALTALLLFLKTYTKTGKLSSLKKISKEFLHPYGFDYLLPVGVINRRCLSLPGTADFFLSLRFFDIKRKMFVFSSEISGQIDYTDPHNILHQSEQKTDILHYALCMALDETPTEPWLADLGYLYHYAGLSDSGFQAAFFEGHHATHN